MRSARVATPEIAAQLGAISGWLVNISASGALVRAPESFDVGRSCPLVLASSDFPVGLTVRIVRVEPMSSDTAGDVDPPHYLVGVLFMDCPASARRAIMKLCGGASGAPPE
jgi:hypothetical protein